MRGFQTVTGGYKLYEDPSAAKRWFFNFELEVPTGLLVDGEVVYQWISYTETTAGVAEKDRTVGAAACKIEVGNYKKTQAIQWVSKYDSVKDAKPYINMSCDNTNEVIDTKWY
jgi:hypothetical protein